MIRSSNTVPFLPDHKVMHLGLSLGDVSNRILTVGHPSRADMLSQFLDAGSIRLHTISSRGFVTYTGNYQGVEISICSIGMGSSMMDFFVREVRSVVPRGVDLFIIRVGTCGGLRRDVPPGTIAVAKEGGIIVRRNYDAFHDESYKDRISVASADRTYYSTSRICGSDVSLTNALLQHLTQLVNVNVVTGLDVSAESFYSTQGRFDTNFVDNNQNLLDQICMDHPTAISMEMETFQLLHLAKCAKDVCDGGYGNIYATAAAVILFNRHTNEVVQEEICHAAEKNAGLSALKTLIQQI